jgi:hypothetical protein
MSSTGFILNGGMQALIADGQHIRAYPTHAEMAAKIRCRTPKTAPRAHSRACPGLSQLPGRRGRPMLPIGADR